MSERIEVQCRVDADRLNKMLDRLTSADTKKAMRQGIRKSASLIRNQAARNLKASINTTGKGGSKPLTKEITLRMYKGASGALIGIVDKRVANSRAFMLKFFNSGTKERRRGHNRGTIEPNYFFSNAVRDKSGEAFQMLEKNILDSIKKIADKK